MKKSFLKWAIPAIIVVFAACNKNDFPKPPAVKPAQGIFVLNEGSSNTASLGYYDFVGKTYGDLFEAKNGFKLGDIANDAVIYGSKMYIVVDRSGLLMICNASTGKLIDSISMKTAGETKNPRNVLAHNGKIYVSTWAKSIEVVDTSSLKIVQSIPVRSGAEGLAISGNNLCAILSGKWPNTDSVVSIIDLSTNTVTKNVYVGYNPAGKLFIDNGGNIYLNKFGKWGSTTDIQAIVKANIQSGQIIKTVNGNFGKILLSNNQLYTIGGYQGFTNVRVYNTSDMTVANENFITDGTTLVRPYGIDIDETNGDVYVTDAKDYQTSGSVYAFDKAGKKKFSFTTTGGVSPNSVLFKR